MDVGLVPAPSFQLNPLPGPRTITDARRESIFAGLTRTLDQRSLLLLRPLIAFISLSVFHCLV